MGGSAISALFALLAAQQAAEGSVLRQFSVGVAVVSTLRLIDNFNAGAGAPQQRQLPFPN